MTEIRKRQFQGRDTLLGVFGNALPVIQAVVSAEGQVLAINVVGANVLGFEPAQIVGRSLSDLGNVVSQAVERFVVRALSTSGVTRGSLLDDHDREWSVMASPGTDDSGERSVALLGIDVTEQRRAQRRVAESQARLKSALEAGFDAFIAMEAIRDETGAITDFQILDVNVNAERLLGRPRWDVTNHNFSEVVGKAWGGDVISKFARVVESRMPVEEEFAVDRDSGTMWLRQQVVPLSDGVAVTTRDVTAQRRAEQAVREHMRVLENALDGIATVSADGRIDFVNSTLASMLERQPESLIGVHWEMLVRPEDREKIFHLLARLESEDRVEMELRGNRSDGMPLFMNLMVLPRFRNGIADGHYVFAVDVTPHRAYEAQLDEKINLLNAAKAELEERSRELERVNHRLRDLATTDGLTGLRNHRHFRERLALEVARADRYGPPITVLMLDVDFFKEYNDEYGHPAGDDVLRLLAKVLQDNVRDTDLVARYGGEEFSIILGNTDRFAAQVMAERIRESMERFAWPKRPITVSIGGASYSKNCRTADSLLLAADGALYAAKRAGRNSVVFV